MLMLYTWPVFHDFTTEKVNQLVDSYAQGREWTPQSALTGFSNGRPVIAVENGWYKIEVLGGEMMQQSSVKNVKQEKW